MGQSMIKGQALQGPHGEIAEYQGPDSYFDAPGAKIRRMAGIVTVPASHIGIEWQPIPGRVVVMGRATGNLAEPLECWLGVLLTGDAP